MILPGDEIPLDDSYDDDADDQQSQKDIHSNGFDEEDDIDLDELDEPADIEGLQQAYDASESAYTLDEDEDDDE
jgi:hypothetical protein